MSAPGRARLPAGWRGGGLLARILGVGIAAFAVGYLLTWVLFFPGWGRDAIVTVPDLRNRPLRQAATLAEDAGLSLVRGSTIASPGVPTGRIVAQNPLPGYEVARGDNVEVIVSSGPDRHPVPSLEGLGASAAKSLLEQYGFQVRVVRATNPAPEGRLLRATPAPGTMVPVPSVVELLVSAGPPMIVAPGVLGSTLDEARARLTAAGLRLGEIGYDPSAEGAAGMVVVQRPAEGDSIRQGSAVGVVVAGADPNPPLPEPDTVAVPDSAVAPQPVEPAAPASSGAAARPPNTEGRRDQ